MLAAPTIMFSTSFLSTFKHRKRTLALTMALAVLLAALSTYEGAANEASSPPHSDMNQEAATSEAPTDFPASVPTETLAPTSAPTLPPPTNTSLAPTSTLLLPSSTLPSTDTVAPPTSTTLPEALAVMPAAITGCTKLRIEAGGTVSYTDSAGNIWATDSGFSGLVSFADCGRKRPNQSAPVLCLWPLVAALDFFFSFFFFCGGCGGTLAHWGTKNLPDKQVISGDSLSSLCFVKTSYQRSAKDKDMNHQDTKGTEKRYAVVKVEYSVA